MPDAFAELQNRLAEIHDIRTAAGLMQWDQEVMMPPGGAPTRAEQRATLERIAHQRFVDDEMGRLFDGAREIEESLPYDSDEASLVRVARRDWEKARRVPTDLAAEMTRVSSQAVEAWARARTESDFAAFKPWLQKTLDLKQRYIACFDPADEPYDVLLDDFEPGMKTATVRAVFDRLKTELVPLIAAARTTEDFAFMSGPFAEEDQHALSIELLEKMGMTPGAYRLDTTVHPFCSGTATQDIRLTTRYDVNSLASLFTAMHEGGHGLYEHGVSASLERTPLCSGCSAALHESQSRLWENVVGRSLPFWRWFFPRLQATFPGVLGLVELDDFHRAVNAVRPSFIRVDADEATYGLHIILRFELELELIAGTLSVDDLPDAWNGRFTEYLGLDVPEDRLGCLQDVHWAFGAFGYFPTYQIGNVMALQIWERLLRDLPRVWQQIERGDFAALHGWLREHLYVLGRKLTPTETLERVVGASLDPAPYIRYLRTKLG